MEGRRKDECSLVLTPQAALGGALPVVPAVSRDAIGVCISILPSYKYHGVDKSSTLTGQERQRARLDIKSVNAVLKRDEKATFCSWDDRATV